MSINSNLLASNEEILFSESDPAFIGPRLEKSTMVNGVELSSHGSPISNTEDIEMEEVEAGAPISPLAGVKISGAAPPSQVLGGRNLTATIQTLTKQVEQVAAAITSQELTGKQLANLSREYTTKSTILASLLDLQAKLANNLAIQTNGSAINGSNSQPTVVPQNLPLFQYTGNVENSALPVYKDIAECIRRFEDILFAYRLDVQVHWQRLIPFSLTHPQRSWYDELRVKKNLSWATFKEQLTLKYGIESTEAQAHASRELLTISMQPDESVEKYTDRFLKLKREATPVADDFLAILFVNSLPGSLQNHVNMAIVSLDQEAKNDINLLSSIARKFHTKQQTLPNTSTRKFNNQPSQVNGLNPPSGIHKRNHRTDGRTCVIHGKCNHTTDRCKKAQELGITGSMNKETFSKRCFKCNAPFTREHLNVCPKRNQPLSAGSASSSSTAPTITRAFRSLQLTGSEDVPMGTKASKYNPANQQDHDEEQDLDDEAVKDIHYYSSLCKLQPFNTKLHSFNNKRTDSFFVPITIENVRTWALVDTGCNASTISPDLAKIINVRTFPVSGKLQLASLNTLVPRTAITDQIKVFYNGINVLHKFEIFKFDKDIPICIGTDLMPKLNINLTGLAVTWDSPNISTIPDLIDPSPIKPNKSPAGTHQQREQLMDALQPYLSANAKIPSTSACPLPEAIVRLETEPGKATYRRQYPIALSIQPKVQEQVDKWLADGVIEIAPPNTAFNSPLLTVLTIYGYV
ncbi:hypothetical protein RO3G_16132 [Rhizopus delemar RA 99-880]|uniref:Retrotransposon gag domain-containing protein n=1 Tax=Rhizopus delemar (strain RA 99-880 / ATCC MYA-4621 / FGSC 9543 / NRRL 43880) TaxID=246409 RepID=I1CSJ1_RHIO9|nr:hypothetical protein RO3G_16132 [Rhizopus delemar RA 99-880]|eukprot:EIE91421.1 hypothetical protein RO3G_16132 [Rhizopus delemar RA 99-880]